MKFIKLRPSLGKPLRALRGFGALLGITGHYWALLGITGHYWALLGITGHYLRALYYNKRYEVVHY